MMSQKEMRFSYHEMSHVILVCSNCRAEVCSDLAKEDQMDHFAKGAMSKPRCGICGVEMNNDLIQAVRSLHEAYSNLDSSGKVLIFRVLVPEGGKEQ